MSSVFNLVSRLKFGGFGLFNHVGRVLKASIEPLRPIPVKSVPAALQNEMSYLSVMRGELDADEIVLLGPIRFANHFCTPNTQFFLGYTSPFLSHSKRVFLKVITSIQPYEEITVSYGSKYFKDGRLKCRSPHTEKHKSLMHENPQDSSTPQIPISLPQSTESSTTGSQYSASQSSSATPINSQTDRKRGNSSQRKRKVKRRLVDDSASRQIWTFIHQVDSSRSSELEILLDDKIERTQELATLYSYEIDSEISSQDGTSVPQSQSEEESSDEAEKTEHDEEVEFAFSSAPLSCNQNVRAHNASMALFGVVARHCLPDEALYDLLCGTKFFHPQDNLPAPNFIKNETRKLTDRYIKGTEANGSGEVIFLSFADKIQEKMKST